MFQRYLLIVSFIFFKINSHVIESYNINHQKRVLEIVFQDPQLFIPGYTFIKQKNEAYVPTLLSQTKIELEQRLENPFVFSFVILDDKKEVVGFISFFRTQEPSIESVIDNAKKLGASLKEEDIRKAFPDIPLKIADAKKYILIESLAIDSSHRNKGYGKALLEYAFTVIAQKWPNDAYIELHVDKENMNAQKLYKKYSFKGIQGQFSQMGIETMRRNIKI